MATKLEKGNWYRYEGEDWGSIFSNEKDYKCPTNNKLLCNSGVSIIVGSLKERFTKVTGASWNEQIDELVQFVKHEKRNKIQEIIDEINQEIQVDPKETDIEGWKRICELGIYVEGSFTDHENWTKATLDGYSFHHKEGDVKFRRKK